MWNQERINSKDADGVEGDGWAWSGSVALGTREGREEAVAGEALASGPLKDPRRKVSAP